MGSGQCQKLQLYLESGLCLEDLCKWSVGVEVAQTVSFDGLSVAAKNTAELAFCNSMNEIPRSFSELAKTKDWETWIIRSRDHMEEVFIPAINSQVKSDISRMRRFADRFKSFDAFQRSEPNATSWHKVRQLVTRDKTSKRAPDSRSLWGVQRSVQASIKALSHDLPTSGHMADEVRSALRNLFRLAQERLEFEIADQTQRVDA